MRVIRPIYNLFIALVFLVSVLPLTLLSIFLKKHYAIDFLLWLNSKQF